MSRRRQTTPPSQTVLRQIFIAGILLAPIGCEPAPKTPSPLAHLSGTHVVEFTAVWCGPCQQMAPALEQYEADTGVEVLKIDIDDQPDIASYFRVSSIPTILVLEDGYAVERHVGAMTLSQLKQRLPNAR